MTPPTKSSAGSASSPGYRLCPTCGTRVGAAATKCLVCGADLSAVTGKTSPTQPIRVGQGTTLGRRPVSLGTVLAILGLVVVVAVVGGAAFYYSSAGQALLNPPTGTATPTETATPTLTFTPLPSDTPEPTATPLPPLDYRIQSGDTCIKIALNSNVSVNSIIDANLGLINPDCSNLTVGGVIKVPQPTPTASPQPTATLQGDVGNTPAPRATYVIQAGDQLQSIARFYSISLGDLMAANSITDANRIRAGQILVIPLDKVQREGPTATPTVPPPHPAPQPLSPADGATFSGGAVVLQWAATSELRPGEAYQVTVINVTANDGRILREIVADTRFVVPAEYLPAGTAAFRWSVTTVRQRPSADASQPPVYDSAGATGPERVFVWAGAAAP